MGGEDLVLLNMAASFGRTLVLCEGPRQSSHVLGGMLLELVVKMIEETTVQEMMVFLQKYIFVFIWLYRTVRECCVISAYFL